MPDLADKVEPYAGAVRRLLKGVVYHDERAIWNQILTHELPIRSYFAQIGLELHLDELGGYAYIKEVLFDDEGRLELPALTQRRELPFRTTLLAVLLRERLDEHERRDVDSGPLIVTQSDLDEMLRLFMSDYVDARRIDQDINTSINHLVQTGFLKEENGKRYRVRPVLRAKISADTLLHIKQKLGQYLQLTGGDSTHANDEPVS